jgi:SRSO17 transposase
MSLPRAPKTTGGFGDHYGAYFQDVFPDVRSFAQFTALPVGMLTDMPRKTLPAIARAVGGEDAQAFHHFLTHSPCKTAPLRKKRLELIKSV